MILRSALLEAHNTPVKNLWMETAAGVTITLLQVTALVTKLRTLRYGCSIDTLPLIDRKAYIYI
ncbi:hypothetical protein D6D00_10157 [Aureobasidium pullulans]|nr:hypothetical protein D6D00_10157 [Aureobasidium pullulans]